MYVPPGCGFSAAELATAATAAVARATLLSAAASDSSNPKKKSSSSSSSSCEIPALFASSLARPVVVYVTGGAWLIGHRAWGSLLAARLSAASGAVVLCLDYRNFPQAGASGASDDVGSGIGWAVAAFDVLSGVKREERGSSGKRKNRDKNNSSTNSGSGGVVVVGQSAGAHLAALAILSRCAASEGVVLPCVPSPEAAARMMSAAAAANALSPNASPSPVGSASSSRSSSVDVEVDATENASVVILSAPPNASSRSRPGSGNSSLAPSSTTAAPKGAKPPSAAPTLQRHPSLKLNNPLHLPSLADAAATLGACDPAYGCLPPPLDPPEWVPSFSLSSSSSCTAGGAGGDIAAFVGVSGVYDVASLAPHLARRGLRPRLLERIMSLPVTAAAGAAAAATTSNGDGRGKRAAVAAAAASPSWRPALAELSPTALLLDCLRRRREDEDASAYLSASPFPLSHLWPARLPPTVLLHGTADACAPASDAARFVEAARSAGAKEASLRLYDGETHTSPLIENPMRGWGRDALGADLAALVIAAAAARRGGGGRNDEDGNGGKKRVASSSAAAINANAFTSATLLRASSSSVLPAPKSIGKQRRFLGAVDGGGPLCPAPLIAAAAAVCPF